MFKKFTTVYLTILLDDRRMIKNLEPGPDPGGPKTCRSGGYGSGTLLL